MSQKAEANKKHYRLVNANKLSTMLIATIGQHQTKITYHNMGTDHAMALQPFLRQYSQNHEVQILSVFSYPNQASGRNSTNQPIHHAHYQ